MQLHERKCFAWRAKNGIYPFSAVPVIDPDAECPDDAPSYSDAILYDDDPASPHYLSLIADSCIVGHHDIISYWDDIHEYLVFKAVEPSSDDDPSIEAAIPFSSLYVYIDEFGWHIYEDSRKREPLSYERAH